MHHMHAQLKVHICAQYTHYMHHQTLVHHQIPPKYKIYPVGLPSVHYETPGPKWEICVESAVFGAFHCAFHFSGENCNAFSWKLQRFSLWAFGLSPSIGLSFERPIINWPIFPLSVSVDQSTRSLSSTIVGSGHWGKKYLDGLFKFNWYSRLTLWTRVNVVVLLSWSGKSTIEHIIFLHIWGCYLVTIPAKTAFTPSQNFTSPNWD